MKKTIIAKLLISILLFAQYGIGQTGASFSDSETKNNNIFTSGWWKTPEVNIVVPQGGEVYALGDTVPIEWEVTLADPTSDYKADVFISKDSGSNYDQVANDLNNATTYDWEIPMDSSYKTTHMMVKVIIEDDHNLIGQDESNEFNPIEEVEIKIEESLQKEEILEEKKDHEEIIEEEQITQEEPLSIEELIQETIDSTTEPTEVKEILEEQPQEEILENTPEEISVEENTKDEEKIDNEDNAKESEEATNKEVEEEDEEKDEEDTKEDEKHKEESGEEKEDTGETIE